MSTWQHQRMPAHIQLLPLPDDGVALSNHPLGWLGTRWGTLLDGPSADARDRVLRGRNYARRGRLRAIDIGPGTATAEVFCETVCHPTLRVRTFGRTEWVTIVEELSRDLDLLAELARHQCVVVNVSVTTLDADLAGKLEPRASRPTARLRAIRELADAGIPVGAMVAPIIPGLTDHEMPAILDAAAAAGATRAGYVVMRLPYAVKDVFLQWLDDHAPSKKARVLDRVRELRGGQLNVSEWGARLRGEGIFADQLRALFQVSARRAGLNQERLVLSPTAFRRPGGEQLSLV